MLYDRMRESAKIRLFYFLVYSALGSWLTFFNVHLESLGFTGFQIGLVNSILISASILVVPLGGMLSDRYGSYRVLLVLTLFSSLLIFLIGFSVSYLSIILLMFALSVFNSPLNVVVDGITLGLIRSDSKYSYGQLRLWGSAGFAVSAVIAGFVASANSANVFVMAAVILAVVALINLITLPPRPVTGRGMVNFKSFSVFLKNRKLLLFFILIFMFGAAISPLHHFINLYYTSIGASGKQIGYAFAVQAFCEVPFFLFGVRYLHRTGPERIIMLAMGISVLRMIMYGLTGNPHVAISIGILHGFTISFFLIGVVEFVQRQTPSHLRVTGQSLIMTFHFGAGLTIGNLWIGYLKDLIGMQQVMLIQAAIAGLIVLATALFFRKQHTIPKKGTTI